MAAPPLTPVGQPWLTYGVSDPSVRWLTSHLADVGWNIKITDTYDWEVAESIAALQRQYGYWTSGETDDETWGLINSVLTGTPVKPFSGVMPQSSPAAPGYQPPASAAAPTPPPAAAPAPQQPTLTNAQNDALARLNVVLNQYGLGSLADWVRSKLVQGASEATIQLELYDRPEFKQRFPAIAARAERGYGPVSPDQVLAYEQQVAQITRMAGLPSVFGEPMYVQSLLAHDISVAELSERVEQGYLKVTEAPSEVRTAFFKYFGVNGDTALASLFLDDTIALPELEKMAMSSFVGGIGSRFGVDLGLAKAREIADTGLSEAAVWQGYRQLDQLSPLFRETLGESSDLSKEETGVGAVFGTEPGAENLLERRRLTRANEFGGSGQGGAYATSKGAVGLGVADG